MGIIEKISGPLVIAKDMMGSNMYDVVRVGNASLIGEVIQLKGDKAVIQVYEDTTGLKPGEGVESTQRPLSVRLGPGLLGKIYDGIQRPLELLEKKSGAFIAKGIIVEPIEKNRKWKFTASKDVKKGSDVKEGDIIGYVQETELIKHYIMIPQGVSGKIKSVNSGTYTINDTVAEVVGEDGKSVNVSMSQERSVRKPSPIRRKYRANEPLVTGQRVIDTLFPVAKGGTAAIPGPFGAGKCVSGDTKILVNNGFMRIKDVFDTANGQKTEVSENETLIELAAPLKIQTFDGERIRESMATHIYRGKTDELLEIRTRSGRRAKLTKVHKLFHLDQDLRVVEKEAGSLGIGDYIISPRKMESGSDYQPIGIDFDCRVTDSVALDNMRKSIRAYKLANNITERQLAERLGVTATTISNYCGPNKPTLSFLKKIENITGTVIGVNEIKTERQTKPIRIPKVLDEEFAELLGLLMSDGMIRGNSTVIFFNNDTRLLDRASFLIKKLFGLDTERSFERTVNAVRVHNRALTKLLESLGYPKSKKSRNLILPKQVFNSPDSVIRFFLMGYIDGDGHIGKKSVEITTASKEMRSGLAYLLLRLGVTYKATEKRVGERVYYRLFIPPKESLKIHPYYSKDFYFNSTDIVPMTSSLFKSILGGVKPHSMAKEGISMAGHYVDQNLTSQMFQRVIQKLGSSYLDGFAKALDYVLCDEIVEIKTLQGPFDVYDITVPETHNFVGGDVPMVLHNTVMQQSLAKYSDADIVVYIGCGERGNEMTDVLTEFPELNDPKTGRPLIERTVLIANTSNMPVAAREASIYTGITIAEYFRDMGYNVAIMADSTSRWAEAMREISARLEEMPGEEGYPAYLPKRLAEYYERSGKVENLNGTTGSVTIIGAVSPPGGDISEPVSQGTLRVVKTFWSLDAALASSRHFPSINWLSSYSLYNDALEYWYSENVGEVFVKNRKETMNLLQREAELKDIVQLVGEDALPDSERVLLEVGRIIREDFLRQSAFDETDAYTSLQKQSLMLDTILYFASAARAAVKKGVSVSSISKMKVRPEISRLKGVDSKSMESTTKKIRNDIDAEFGALVEEMERGAEEEEKKEEGKNEKHEAKQHADTEKHENEKKGKK